MACFSYQLHTTAEANPTKQLGAAAAQTLQALATNMLYSAVPTTLNTTHSLDTFVLRSVSSATLSYV
jgi:hypothetical protein